MFDTTSEAATDEQQVQAETTPHRLTQMALAGAGNPTSTKGLLVTLALLKQNCSLIASNPDVLASSEERGIAALVCARHVMAHLAEPFADLIVDYRYEIICEWFQWANDDARVEEFWTLLSNLLYGYAGHLSSDFGWRRAAGLIPEDDPHFSMPVWRTETGRYVCDLLAFLTPFDSDESIRERHVDQALALGHAEFGDAFGGVQVVPPLSSHLTRWYHPDGTWEMWSEDVPNFHDLLDEALSEMAQS